MRAPIAEVELPKLFLGMKPTPTQGGDIVNKGVKHFFIFAIENFIKYKLKVKIEITQSVSWHETPPTQGADIVNKCYFVIFAQLL